MNSFNREQYLKQLRMYYSGDRNDMEQFLEDMSDSLDCYLEEHPSATPAEIFQHFGHPKELEEQYEKAVSKRRSKLKRILSKLMIILICLACISALIAFFIHSRDFIAEVNGHADVILKEYNTSSDTPMPIGSPSPKTEFYLNE